MFHGVLHGFVAIGRDRRDVAWRVQAIGFVVDNAIGAVRRFAQTNHRIDASGHETSHGRHAIACGQRLEVVRELIVLVRRGEFEEIARSYG